MVTELLDKPVPIIFAVCQGWQKLENGTMNFLGIFDKMFVRQAESGQLPEAVNLPVVATWTGGHGDFTQLLRALDQDGNVLTEHQTPFHLDSTSARHHVITPFTVPVIEGVISLTVGRSDEELLRQDFTFEVVQPGT